MRPQSIVNFERIIFATLILGVIQAYLGWDRATHITSVGFILTVQIFTFALFVLLTVLVAHRRSKIAKWVLVVMFVLGLPLFYHTIAQGMLIGSAWISAVQTVGQAVAYGLLFTRSARSWLDESN